MSKKLAIIALLALTFVTAKAQTAVQPIPDPHMSFVNAVGLACAGCKLSTFAAGTTTSLATFTDSTGAVQNTNPVILDLTGSANIWGSQAAYKFVLEDPLGNILFTEDNIPVVCTVTSCPPATAASIGAVSLTDTSAQTMAGPLNVTGSLNVTGLLNASAPGSFSSSGVSNCANVGFINGANLTAFNGANGPVQGAVCGALQTGTTEGNNVIEAPAVIGLADNFTNAPGGAGGSGGTDAVGGYFQGRIMQAGTPTVQPVAEGLNVAGIVNASWGNGTGIEIDMDVGSGATNASLIGLNVSAPNITVAPRFSTAIEINVPGGTVATPWGTGITVQNGATAIGLELGKQNLTATSASQTILMVGENAGTETASTIGQDPAGNILLTPNSSSQSVSITGGLNVSGSVAAVGNGSFANLSTVGNLTASAIFASAGAAVHLIAGSGAGSSLIVTNGAQTINVLTIDNSGNASFPGTVSSTGYSVSGTTGVTSTTCTQWTGGICTHS
jgi:hypothetical protein